MDQIVDIETDGRHLAKYRGFMVVTHQGDEIGRVPLDRILAVIVHAHGITYSNNLLVALAERGALVVLCAANHQPRAVMWPLEAHHAQGSRMRAQWTAKAPLLKQLWKHLVVAKIEMQAAALDCAGHSPEPLLFLARQVRSGDPANVEAQAARRYWPLMMGRDFRRDPTEGGANALLNYGYTVLRSAVARSVVAVGLNPTIGVHHANRSNAFALADDVMEPFRPLVDCTVRGLIARGICEVTSDAKATLARLIATDLDLGEIRSPLSMALSRLAVSLAGSFEGGRASLVLPRPPGALELAGLGA